MAANNPSTDALLLGIDIGTTNVKAVLATPAGQVVAQAQTAYPTRHLSRGGVEQNPEDWWQSAVKVVRTATAGFPPEGIAGIGVSGQGCAVTLIDQQGDVIRPAIIWMDTRSEPQCEQLRQTCADDILRINGKQPAPYNADPALMWLRQNEPESIEKAACSLTSTAYINFRLTGEAVCNHSDASILFAYDLHRRAWSPKLIEAFGLSEKLYPHLAECHEVIGGLASQAAAALGLPAGIPVIAGGEDTSSAGLAVGAVREGQAFLSLGTAGTIYVSQDGTPIHPQLLTFLHVIAGQSLIGGSMMAAGGAMQWGQQALLGEVDFDALTNLAAESEPGAGGLLFLPYLNGELQPVNDGYARGVFFGLNFNTSRSDMLRAVMEGVGFAVAHNLHIARQVGTAIGEIRAVGAPASNRLWCQIIADITGMRVLVDYDNAGAPLGDALLAGHGVGLIPDLAATAAGAGHATASFDPRPENRQRYERLFEIYRQLYPRLRESFAELQQANREI
jgi:xylulokinase